MLYKVYMVGERFHRLGYRTVLTCLTPGSICRQLQDQKFLSYPGYHNMTFHHVVPTL